MRRLLVVSVIVVLGGAVVLRHPVERALGLGRRPAPTAAGSQAAVGTTGSHKSSGGTSSGTGASKAGRGTGSVKGQGGATGTSGATAHTGNGASVTGQGAGQGTTTSGGGVTAGAGKGAGGAGNSGGGAASTGGAGTSASGGAAGSSGGAASSGSAGTATAPPVTSYPGASAIAAFYADVSAGKLADAYALLAPSLQGQQSQSVFAQAYAGVKHATVQTLAFQSAGNFSRTFDVTVVIATATGTQTVSGAITVQDQSGGVGTPDYAISALGVAP